MQRIPIDNLPIGVGNLSSDIDKSAWTKNVMPSRELLDLEIHDKPYRRSTMQAEMSPQPVNFRFDAGFDGITVSCGAHSAASKKFVIRSGMQLVIPQSGSTEYQVRSGPRFCTAAGSDASILGPGEYRSTSSKVSALVIHVDEQTIGAVTEIATQIGITLISSNVRTLPLRHPRYLEPVKRLQKIYQLLAQRHDSDLDVKALLVELLLDILMIEVRRPISNLKVSSAHRCSDLNKAWNFIHANINRELTNYQLCQELGLSLQALFRLCDESVGCTPQVWIQSLRLERALQLMKAYPDCINLQCIAKDVGYGTFQEFRSFFFNYFGRSPEQIQTSLSVRSKKTALMPAPKSNN